MKTQEKKQEGDPRERFKFAFISLSVASGRSKLDSELAEPYYWEAIKHFQIVDVIEYMVWWAATPHGETRLFHSSEFAQRVRSHISLKNPKVHPKGDPCENCTGLSTCKNLDYVHGLPQCRTPEAIAAKIEFMKTLAEIRYTQTSRFCTLSEAMYGEFVGKPYEKMKAEERKGE